MSTTLHTNRNQDIQDDPLVPAKKKRRRRHSHMDSIYTEFDVREDFPEGTFIFSQGIVADC